jgi:hypothetical protein
MRCKKCDGKLKNFINAIKYFSFLTVKVLRCNNEECGVLHDTIGNIHYRRVKGISGGYELRYKNKIPGGSLCRGA